MRHAVDRAEVSVSAAAEVATWPVEQQRELVAAGGKEIIAAARKIKTEKRVRKADARAADTELTGALQPSLEQQADAAPLRHGADFDITDRGIDDLYSRWTVLAYRAIQEADVLRKFKTFHEKADAERRYRDAVRKLKKIYDKAAAWEMRYHNARDVDAERTYREIRLLAQRTGGRLLINAAKKKLRYMGRPPKGIKIGRQDPALITLDKLGISRKESQDWQKIARLSDGLRLCLPVSPHVAICHIADTGGGDFATRRDAGPWNSRETHKLTSSSRSARQCARPVPTIGNDRKRSSNQLNLDPAPIASKTQSAHPPSGFSLS